MAEVEKPSPDDFQTRASSFFVVKCGSLDSLKKCISAGVWAFRKRNKPPQPHDILEEAHAKPDSKVILIFSVNNQHGWHGYCESLYPLNNDKNGSSAEDAKNTNTNNNSTAESTNGEDEWCRFVVKWITHFQSLNSYECLHFDKTEGMDLLDNSCINKARNWQEMSQDVGTRMCELIDQHFTNVCDKKRVMEHEKLEEIKAKESFFTHEENAIGLCEDISTGWQTIIQKVEKELGKVILACPFGSQRYNCSLPDSDSDILLVYQAKTVDTLGLDRPQQTIKNSHTAKMDYTILELQRYCELLVAGDPRYIETLFIEEESILAVASLSWKQLCDLKHILLTNDCLEKYLREAKGTKGLKQFEKWKTEIKDNADSPPLKLNKLAYIILRLLQSGRDIVKHGCIRVYRKDDSLERQELLNSRLGHFSVSEMQELFDRYTDEIEQCRANASFGQPDIAKTKVHQWLVTTRLHNLRGEEHPGSL